MNQNIDPPPKPLGVPTGYTWSPTLLTLVYDSRRHVTVALGGTVSPQNTGKLPVFQYDGTQWAEDYVLGMPPWRDVGGAAFDMLREKLVIYGGWISNTQHPIDELWEYDGTNWQQREHVEPWPPSTIDAPMAFDPYRGRLIMLAVSHAFDGTWETWEWDGDVWDRGPDLGPVSPESMVFDTWRNKAFLYAGQYNGYLEQTWEYTPGATAAQGVWQQIPITGDPYTTRISAALAYDPHRGRIIRHGGRDSTNIYGYNPATYVWDVAASRWIYVDTMGYEDRRMAASMCFDTYRDRAVLYGGINSYIDNDGVGRSTNFTDTWEWLQESPALADPTAPNDVTSCPGSSATFAVTAIGGPYDYQWFRESSPIPGASGTILFLPNVGYGDAGSYNLRASNPCGAMFSRNAYLSVPVPVSWDRSVQWPAWTCPDVSVFIQPSTPAGTDVVLELQRFDGEFWQAVPGQRTGAGGNFYLANLQKSDTGDYRVVASNHCGTIVSDPHHIQVGVTFDGQPASQSLAPCDTAVFSAPAQGFAYVDYQWQRNGNDLVTDGRITGATSSNLTIAGAHFEDEGVYRCRVTDGCESVYSNPALLTLPTPGWVHRTSSGPVRRLAYTTDMAYNLHRGVSVLYGGFGPGDYLDDTWEWDGVEWTQRFPAHNPGKRGQHEMVFDTTRNTVLLFGGWSATAGLNADVWEYDGIDWTLLTTSPNGPTIDYGKQGDVAYDSARGKMILLAEYVYGPTPTNRTWEFDSRAATWQETYTGNGPTPYDTPIVFDPVRGYTLAQEYGLVGSWQGSYAYANNIWSAFSGAAVLQRYWPVMAYDTVRSRPTAYGCCRNIGSPSAYHTDTYAFSGDQWQQILPEFHPNLFDAEVPAAMVFDTRRRAMVMVGNTYNNSTGQNPLDTWEYRYLDEVVFDRQPADVTATSGQEVSLEVFAAGASNLAYQWQKNGMLLADGPGPDGSIISGTTTASLSIFSTQPMNSGEYAVQVTNRCGSKISASAQLQIFLNGDCDGNGNVDLVDFEEMLACLGAPNAPVHVGCACFDLNEDGAADLRDFAALQLNFLRG
ncbi:MAG: immunoglobulin domain-containing protein [Phycisphaerae bacterium]|nr:immunoglobulin domain-containing protein [Phycisphaerae bacterium]